MICDVTWQDFQPFNVWTPDTRGEKWPEDRSPKYLKDETTQRPYWNEDEAVVRKKCAWLAIGTPIFHAIALVGNVAYRIIALLTLSHFWWPKEGEKEYSLKERAKDAGKDLLRIVAAPFVYVALEVSAIYGLFRPYDGRKLYASLERAEYGEYVLAPCFQPKPRKHAFGGDPNTRNAF